MKIDAFAHILSPRYKERVFEILRARNDQGAEEYEKMLGFDTTLTDIDARFALMDEIGSDYRQVLVMAHTSVEGEPPEVAAEVASLANDELAETVGAHRDRFAGWVAQIALQDGDRALESVERAINEQGALGAQVFTMTQGKPLDHPDFEPFFALMADLDRPIWIHPNRSIEYSDYQMTERKSRYGLYSRAQWPADTTITLARLVYSGYLERWPELKIVSHHSGGTVPMIAGRFATHHPMRGADGIKVAATLTRPVIEYFKRFYADTATFGNPIQLRAAVDFFGADRVLYGTDFGFSPTYALRAIDDVEEVVTDAIAKQQIYEDNARRVLRLPAS